MNAVELDEEPLKAASGYVFYNISKFHFSFENSKLL